MPYGTFLAIACKKQFPYNAKQTLYKGNIYIVEYYTYYTYYIWVVKMTDKQSGLKKRIIEEMTVDYSTALEKNFDTAKLFVRVTKEGKIDVTVKEKISGQDQLLLYLIGKLYAKEVGFSTTDDVGNKEFIDELGIPLGSLSSWLKRLRDKNKIRSVKRGKNIHHTIPINTVERTLKMIGKKIKKTISV